jgi:outer membrane receptor protein involved in Fe transport
LSDSYDWFARADYIYKGSQWATHANVTETGDRSLVNLRVGVENDDGLRLEAYATNIFDEKTFTGYQRLNDFAFFGAQFMTAGLPDKPAYGIRATYNFDLSN